MTVEEVKAYLEKIRGVNNLIRAKTAEKKRLESMAISLSSPKLGDKVQTSQINNSMTIIEKIDELQHEIDNEIKALVEIHIEVHNFINKLPNYIERDIMTERYLNCKGFKEIAREKNYSERHVFNIYDSALKHCSKFH